jgi:SAM-dependent methyltransferase
VPEHRVGPVVIRRQALSEVDGQYDAIIFNHVLEHIEEPIEELGVAATRLRPGGHVIVRVPLADSEACERYGEHWAQLDAPRHVTLPTQRALEQAVGRVGLRVVDAWRDSNAFQFWGSEQYLLGITKFGERSWEADREHSPFTAKQVRAWEADAHRLNRAGRGDQGAFVLARV